MMPAVRNKKSFTGFELGGDKRQFILNMARHGRSPGKKTGPDSGIRDDLDVKKLNRLPVMKDAVTLGSVIDGLPRIRSGISSRFQKGQQPAKIHDDPNEWRTTIAVSRQTPWFKKLNNIHPQLKENFEKSVALIQKGTLPTGSQWKRGDYKVQAPHLIKWYGDNKLKGVIQHVAKAHMDTDLHRYLFCALFLKATKRSPLLADFPDKLLPDHKKVQQALRENRLDTVSFKDMFRVQASDVPGKTMTKHLQKDGHAFIHYAPEQCRSLSVREAARAQTFPDNYYFVGLNVQRTLRLEMRFRRIWRISWQRWSMRYLLKQDCGRND